MEKILNEDSYRKISKSYLDTIITYSANMRFVLIDKEKRLFNAERYNYRGSIDDWMNIDYFQPLDELVKKYVKHLGQESFFELY